MHVNAKKMAVTGLLLAFNVVLIVLSGVFEFNTLFLLAAASFLIGIVIREYNLITGLAFYVGAVLLGLIVAPNKLYCFTFAAMGVYILAIEGIHRLLGKSHSRLQQKSIFIIAKYVVFNLIFIPILFLFPQLLFAGKLSTKIIVIAIVGGQAALFLYDKGYEYFQYAVWSRFRKSLGF